MCLGRKFNFLTYVVNLNDIRLFHVHASVTWILLGNEILSTRKLVKNLIKNKKIY
jgi:hypothetical protein